MAEIIWQYLNPGRLTPIEEALAVQEKLFQQKLAGDPGNYVLFAEHEPCITYSRPEQLIHLKVAADILGERGLPLLEVSGRGGSITYHGPGQIVMYLIVDIGGIGLTYKIAPKQTEPTRTVTLPDAHRLLSVIDSAIIQTLATYNLVGGRKPLDPRFKEDAKVWGAWIDGIRKIASHGLRPRYIYPNLQDTADIRLISSFGGALNVNTDLSGFSHINPCGYPIRMTSMQNELGRCIDMQEVITRLVAQFTTILGISFLEK